MHAATIILLVLLGLLVLALCIIAFIALSIYWTLQPIWAALGKVSMGLEIMKFLHRRFQKWRKRS
ncbi:hypothetical protein [Alicyclobacillus dauci]|uniref:Uncharacterized protein n=1 Tax=Alicyclobacillus dauci TaxID=1475485 RepID=A0ABY6Z538_9BACL|nr:hypothetical protein [Alicyclobacillus dauci]WAH37638.1 hypothetical protein NZD86_03665 [Alicyclobacillus dauci]